MKISTKEVREVVSLLDEIIESYKKESVEKKRRDWRTYEQRLTERIKGAIKDLEPLIDEAVSSLKIVNGETRGRKSELSLKQKVILILVHRLVGKSNRGMSCMLALFSLLSDVDVSYKTVERLYSDDIVILVLHNLHILILRRKGVETVKGSGDGTGYSLTIKKHYATEAQKLKDKLKKNSPEKKVSAKKKEHKKRQFAYCFKLMDIDTRMYIAYGTSLKSEDEAYQQALNMVEELNLDIDIDSLRLDRYYSKQQYVKQIEEKFGNVKIYLIPKKNATIKGSWKWKRMLHKFVNETKEYLKEYFQRNNSENGFSEDKRRLGWKLAQKREDRLDTAIFCNQLWHNLFWLN